MSRGRLRFAATLSAFAAVVFFSYREEVLGAALAPLTAWTAQATVFLLELFDADVAREATVVYQPGGFAYEIYFRCTGILPVASLGVAILAFQAGSLRKKLIGLALGAPLIVAINLLRLVHLFRLGVTRPELFSFAHSVLWEAGIVLAVVGVWAAWLAWIRQRPRLERLA